MTTSLRKGQEETSYKGKLRNALPAAIYFYFTPQTQIRKRSSVAKDKKDPGLARHVFFDRDLRWLCHRIDRRTGEDVWCPYYWKCMQLIVKEKPEIDPAAQNVLEKEPSIQSSPSIDVKVREAI